MAQADDKTFIRRFSGIIIGLVIFTILIIVLAVSFELPENPENNPSQMRLAAERIKPVAAVNTGDASPPPAAATPSPGTSAAETVAAASGALDGSLDGNLIYDNVCSACHNAGVAGAPMMGDQMAARLEEKGLETLVYNAINGINVMPARGGNSALTDEQVQVAVEYMLNP